MGFILERRARCTLLPHVGLVLIAAACAHVPVKSDIETSRVFDADFEHTWAAVIETSAQLVVPVESIAKDSGLLTLRRTTAAPPDWMDCYEAEGNAARDYPQVARINIFVKPLSDRQTQVTVNTFFERTHVLLEQAECFSTGRVERLFFAGIARNL